MESLTKNLIIVLSILTLLFAAYYFSTQQDFNVSFSSNQQALMELQSQATMFIERQGIISQVALDTTVFSQVAFNQLRGYTAPVEPQPIGRPNPFLPVDNVRPSSLPAN